jgi:hypothetical protein
VFGSVTRLAMCSALALSLYAPLTGTASARVYGSQSIAYSQSAEQTPKGAMFVTQGLICDSPSQIDAVVTLSNSGEPLDSALLQINAGAELPRCVIGRMLFARYEEKAQTFSLRGQTFTVHRVLIIAVGVNSSDGIVPTELKTPLEQFVVTADTSQPV